jgi:hypothetical protein
MIEIMAQIDFESWIEQTAGQPGVLACGVKASRCTAIKSADSSFPEQRVKELMLALAEVGLTLRQDQLSSGRWRWIFENGQIQTARRPDGAIAVLILTNDSLMTSVAESALAEFVSAVAPADPATEVVAPIPDENAAMIANS